MSLASKDNRKTDTRRKIQMGGLVIKAKMDTLFDAEPKILLGAQLFLKDLLEQDKDGELITHFRKLGGDAFESK